MSDAHSQCTTYTESWLHGFTITDTFTITDRAPEKTQNVQADACRGSCSLQMTEEVSPKHLVFWKIVSEG